MGIRILFLFNTLICMLCNQSSHIINSQIYLFFLALNFFNMMQSILFDNNDDTDEIEVLVWEILTYTAYVEMYDSAGSIENDTVHVHNKLMSRLHKLEYSISNGMAYPCSYLFMFRSTLLNKNLNQLSHVCWFCVHIMFMCIVHSRKSLLLGLPVELC